METDTTAVLTDSHCHLTIIIGKGMALDAIARSLAEGNLEAVVDVSTEAGGFGEREAVAQEIETSVRLTRPGFRVYLTVGISPSENAYATGSDVRRSQLAMVEENASRSVAIGEIGLEYHWNYGTKEAQRELFEGQLEIASRTGLPVVVHTREADADTASILKGFSLPRAGVIHCFSSDWDFARACLDLGFCLSFAGNLTYKGTEAIREAARRTPADRILVETDSPFLAPVPMRGKTNLPAFVAHTAAFLANLRGEPLAELAETVNRNFSRVFATERAGVRPGKDGTAGTSLGFSSP